MAKELTIISNDWHIDHRNGEVVYGIVKQKLDYAKSKGLRVVYIIGDIFESRQAQPLSNLKSFERVLTLFEEYSILGVFIPGNHDKTNYASESSFLDAYKHWPFVSVVNDYIYNREEDCLITIHLLPFFEEEILHEKIEAITIKNGVKNILLSHFALCGSQNNDGKLVENGISKKLLSKFDKVYLGHYHNTQEVTKDIVHLPSLCQKNYGEDENKGFTVLFEDGSYKIINSTFNKFTTVKIDLNKVSKKELTQILADLSSKKESNNIRIKFSGDKDKQDSLKLQSDSIKKGGFDVKFEDPDIVVSIEEAEEGNVVEFDNTSILEEFEILSEKENFEDSEVGLTYLKKAING
jgi:exonuclease SbcD